MGYTKSQVLKITEEQRSIIINVLDTIDYNVEYISTDKGYNFKCKMYVDGALEKLCKALDVYSDVVINTDNYILGVYG